MFIYAFSKVNFWQHSSVSCFELLILLYMYKYSFYLNVLLSISHKKVECRCLRVAKTFLSQRGQKTFTAVTKLSISFTLY